MFCIRCQQQVVTYASGSGAGVRPGRHADHSTEVPGQMCLVVEPDGGGDIGGRHAVEQQAARAIDSTAGDVTMWRQAVLAAERTDELSRMRSEHGGERLEGRTVLEVVELVAHTAREAGLLPMTVGLDGVIEVSNHALADQRQPRLGL